MLLDELELILGNNASIRVLSLLMAGKTITLRQIMKRAHIGYIKAKGILENLEMHHIVNHWMYGKTNAYRIRDDSKVIEILKKDI